MRLDQWYAEQLTWNMRQNDLNDHLLFQTGEPDIHQGGLCSRRPTGPNCKPGGIEVVLLQADKLPFFTIPELNLGRAYLSKVGKYKNYEHMWM